MTAGSTPHFSIAFLIDLQRKAGNQATVRLLGKKSALVVVDIDDSAVADTELIVAAESALVVSPAPKAGLWLRVRRILRLAPCDSGVEP